jgi:hypothetical protein
MSSSDSDSDNTIATTKIFDAANFDTYSEADVEHALNPLAREWKPSLTNINNMVIQLLQTDTPQNLWRRIVEENNDRLYEWIAELPVQFIHKSFFGQGRIKFFKQRLSKRHIIFLLSQGGVRRYKNTTAPPHMKKIIKRVVDLSIHDIWYSLPAEERSSISRFLKLIGVDWFEKHVV